MNPCGLVYSRYTEYGVNDEGDRVAVKGIGVDRDGIVYRYSRDNRSYHYGEWFETGEKVKYPDTIKRKVQALHSRFMKMLGCRWNDGAYDRELRKYNSISKSLSREMNSFILHKIKKGELNCEGLGDFPVH